MSNEIPPTDPDLKPDASHGERPEFDILEANAKLKRLAHREIGQRFWLRWIAVAVGLVVIAGMALMLYRAFFMESPPVVMIIAPIASITAVTVALFVGAFRKFEDKDLENVGRGVTRGTSMFRGE